METSLRKRLTVNKRKSRLKIIQKRFKLLRKNKYGYKIYLIILAPNHTKYFN